MRCLQLTAAFQDQHSQSEQDELTLLCPMTQYFWVGNPQTTESWCAAVLDYNPILCLPDLALGQAEDAKSQRTDDRCSCNISLTRGSKQRKKNYFQVKYADKNKEHKVPWVSKAKTWACSNSHTYLIFRTKRFLGSPLPASVLCQVLKALVHRSLKSTHLFWTQITTHYCLSHI